MLGKSLVSERGLMPPRDYEGEKWHAFGRDIKSYLENPRSLYDNDKTMQFFERRGIKNLERLDGVLGIIEKNWGNKDKYGSDTFVELVIQDGHKEHSFLGSPERKSIYSKFLHFWDVLNGEKKIQKGDGEYLVGWNVVKDCRRVIKGVLNDEPLYLISEQVKTFKRFNKLLSASPESGPFPYLFLKI